MTDAIPFSFGLTTFVLIVLTFFVGGLFKGLTGLGLPPVVLGILTATIGIQPAKALIIIPTFLTNVFQAVRGGHGRKIIHLTWPFLLAATLFTLSGALTLSYFQADVMSALLGVGLAVYGILGLFRLRVNIRGKWWNHPVGASLGAVNGFLTGMTGSSAVPGVFYLQSIGLLRDQLIQSMGILFTLSTVSLAWSLRTQDLLDANLLAMSAVSLAPAFLGMSIGNRIRRSIPEEKFHMVLCAALILLGLYITALNLAK
ncbi:sulfite exporter TauE/SafE family protein [Streptomyces sp. NPDC021212]|uniref:sulfite exporter TauE/SafE family protein n=1 Tax=Streptomyces sp. NPDC021212 TaxID=3365118 RepID=UPI0037A4F7AA